MPHSPVTLERPVDADDHMRGSHSAPVTLVEYGDFECPFCARAYAVVKQLLVRYASELCFVFRHTPRAATHPHAQHAAEAAEAAGAQGKFWEMHDRLFENPNALGDADLKKQALALGLDAARFDADFASHAFAARVHAQEAAAAHTVLTTPTFFVNGERFDDTPDVATLGAAIERAAAAAKEPHGLR